MAKQIKVQTLIIHSLLWAGYGLVVFYFMSFPFDAKYAWALSARVVFIHALLFYLNTDVILPRLFERGKYAVYVLSTLTLIILVYYFFNLTSDIGIFREALDSIRPLRQFQGPRPIFSRWMISNMLSSTAILFISTTYWLITRERRRRQEELSLINENLQSEMKFLKSQINPHFLFNALNNIYSLMRSNSQNAQQMILKLSEMLRYVIYDSNEKRVPLVKEIDYILNYISFQKLKYETEVNITADFQEVDGSLYVEPMLFIPFIENSFKHSRIEDDKESWIFLKLKTQGSKVSFTLENSVPKTEFSKDATGGIGIQNVRKRLELLYPGKYWLNIEEKEKEYSVFLEIETQ